MATFRGRRGMQKRLLESIGNKSPEELGALAMEMMENTMRLYDELGVDADGADEFEFSRDMTNTEDRARMEEMERKFAELETQYRQRFGGTGEDTNPVSQPPADDITIQIDPNSGQEITEELETVSDRDIFGEEFLEDDYT